MNRGKLIPEQVIGPAQMGFRVAAAFDKPLAILKQYQLGYITPNGEWRLAPSMKRVHVVPEHSILFVHELDWKVASGSIVGTFLLDHNLKLVFVEYVNRKFDDAQIFDIRMRIMFDHGMLMQLGARYGD